MTDIGERTGPALAGLFVCAALWAWGGVAFLGPQSPSAAIPIAVVTGPGGEATTFGYDAAGNRTSAVLPNGITTTWAYDARNRVTRVEHKTTATGAVQAFYESTWNAQGLRATQRYSQAAGQGCLATYTYDTAGSEAM